MQDKHRIPEYFDGRFKDPSELTDSELDEHIATLKRSASEHYMGWERHDVTVLTMLQLAIADKHRRIAAVQVEASNRLARETLDLGKNTLELTKETLELSRNAIRLWWVTIGIAAFSLIVAFAGLWLA